MNEPGTLSQGAGGVLHIHVEAERYRIEQEDVKNLLFYSRVVPITQDCTKTRGGNYLISEVAIEGHATVNGTGKAVMLHTRVGSFIIPLVSFQRVARGEAVSAPLFPLIQGVTG
ncbi:hypothetical protein ABH15_07560 [Methanoculleus taiwanensis]|uniref:Uncharacterized protein n=1 Tax=Methanoculleus taiwanensis TaxID=1550565 RepID=A0A498H087_9EURY|nr:hypothetical protein [Methanoculleus taiwanensis]RXE56043.1 hypothetical protein ABH15_07560 [Methanoculleus taiwanensis]